MLTNKAKWMTDSEGTWVCFLAPSIQDANAMTSKINSERTYDVEAKEHTEKRSLNANAYMWQLCSKIAVAIHSTKEEVYQSYIKQVGVFKDFTLAPDAAKTFRVAWGKLGTGWVTEQVDYAPDGNNVVVRAYYGSSQYNRRRMSKLIDLIVEDCKQMGIETLTPRELSLMVERWEQ